MSERLRIGISTCPNDTFAFHGLLSGAIGVPGVELEFELADVEALNQGLLSGRYDVAKASFHAALLCTDRCVVLPSGAALGRGVGPVVVAARALPRQQPPRVLCPGEHTTATLLWKLFHPEPALIRQRVFSEILPALARGEADLGVCIHEGRFTYRSWGLELVEDMGTLWERATGAPLPLGGLLVRRSLPDPTKALLALAVRASIEHGFEHRREALETMRAHAREQADDVLWAHVELYVNAETLALSTQGERALELLFERAVAAGLVPPDAPAIEVARLPPGGRPPRWFSNGTGRPPDRVAQDFAPPASRSSSISLRMSWARPLRSCMTLRTRAQAALLPASALATSSRVASRVWAICSNFWLMGDSRSLASGARGGCAARAPGSLWSGRRSSSGGRQGSLGHTFRRKVQALALRARFEPRAPPAGLDPVSRCPAGA